jgi:hypothetical protein
LFPSLLNLENSGDDLWGDTAFAGKRFSELIKLAGYEQKRHQKGSELYTLEEDLNQQNRTKSKV